MIKRRVRLLRLQPWQREWRIGRKTTTQALPPVPWGLAGGSVVLEYKRIFFSPARAAESLRERSETGFLRREARAAMGFESPAELTAELPAGLPCPLRKKC